jgi:four helix bundle protein
LESQILIAPDLGFLAQTEAEDLLQKIREVGRILNGLLKSLEKKQEW